MALMSVGEQLNIAKGPLTPEEERATRELAFKIYMARTSYGGPGACTPGDRHSDWLVAQDRILLKRISPHS